MNSEDIRQLADEREASPTRFNYLAAQYPQSRPDDAEPIELEPVESSSSSVRMAELRGTARRPNNMTRQSTMTDLINVHESHPTALERIETHRHLHLNTVGTHLSRRETKASKKDLPNFGAGKPYPPNLPDREEYVVEFDGPHDPMHAQNWPMKKKVMIGFVVSFTSLCATFGSSVFSPATQTVARIFGVSAEVGTLTTSLYVLGYAFGPIVWAPMSELYGRKIPILIATFSFGVFSVAVAVAKDLQTIMICRFFGGFFGSCPLAVVGAIMADMFNNKLRGLAIATFSATVFFGPLLAPFIGGFITTSYLGWRWTEYITCIMGFTAFTLNLFFLKETYPPVILVDKAAELRRLTKNWGIHAKQEEIEVDLKELLSKNVSRPLRILFTEPIVLLISLYMSLIYGILYLFLTAYAIVFQRIHHESPGIGGLNYFGMIAGMIVAFCLIVYLNPSYVKKLEANNNIPVPEWRLPVVVFAGAIFAAGLFWFAWTGYTDTIHWIAPCLSGLFTGFGIFCVFLQSLNYIIDAYLMFAASAIAANTFMRSLFGCIFPLFATYMFDGIGVNWAGTLLGCVAALCVPMPICFIIFGRRLRAKSKFAPSLDIKQDEKRRLDEEARGAADGDASPTEDEEKRPA